MNIGVGYGVGAVGALAFRVLASVSLLSLSYWQLPQFTPGSVPVLTANPYPPN